MQRQAVPNRAIDIGNTHEPPDLQVQAVEIVAPYTLRVAFDDNTHKVIDFRPVLGGELYSPLQDLQLFNQVRIDPEVRTIV
jgi:hypothetical protein